MKKAFTLIEVLVASMIFIVVLTIGTTSFLGASRVSAKIKVTRQTVEQARFAMETMIREIRLAKSYELVNAIFVTPNYCSSKLSLATLDAANTQKTIIYALETDAITRQDDSAILPQPITDKTVIAVDKNKFSFCSNAQKSDDRSQIQQPNIAINLAVSAADGKTDRPETQYDYTLKSSATLRNFVKSYLL